ncbi:MAG: hypothetical protein WA952_08085 [Lewinella sp.]
MLNAMPTYNRRTFQLPPFAVVLWLMIGGPFGCSTDPAPPSAAVTPYRYGTQHDSALYYYNQGWEQIMDNGQWTLSEQSFRDAVAWDSTFIIGKSLVGKNTRDLSERTALLKELKKVRHTVSADNRFLLDITLKTLELFNARDRGETLDSTFVREFYLLGENNYRKFIHRYPRETYMKAEYIEFLHANHGPAVALDSMRTLFTEEQQTVPFFLSYSAILESELGNHQSALDLAERLRTLVNDPDVPEPHVLYAKVYTAMDSLILAKGYIDRALVLDSNHIIAHRVRRSIEKRTTSYPSDSARR